VLRIVALLLLLLASLGAEARAQLVTNAAEKARVLASARLLLVDPNPVEGFQCDVRSEWFGRFWNSLWNFPGAPDTFRPPPCPTIAIRGKESSEPSITFSLNEDPYGDSIRTARLQEHSYILTRMLQVVNLIWLAPEQIFFPKEGKPFRLHKINDGYMIFYKDGRDSVTTRLDFDMKVASTSTTIFDSIRIMVIPIYSQHEGHPRIDSLHVTAASPERTMFLSMSLAYTTAQKRTVPSVVKVWSDHFMWIFGRDGIDIPVEDVLRFENYEFTRE
jgi:hypothetical protein